MSPARAACRKLSIVLLAAVVGAVWVLSPAPVSQAQTPTTTTKPAVRTQTETEKKAIDYLLTRQDPNGAWFVRVGPGLTAMVVKGLIQGGKSIDDPAVKKGLDYIASTRHPDGGYYVQGLATYHTSIVLSMLTQLPKDQYKEEIKKAQDFLKGSQIQEGGKDNKGATIDAKHPWYGGWGYGGGNMRPDLSNTHFVVEALRDSGVPADDPTIQRALVFVTRMQASSETNEMPWAKGRSDGGFIYAMGWNSRLNMYGESSAPSHQDRDGNEVLTTYGSITYAGLKSLIYANLTKDDPRVKAAVKWVSENWSLDANPGMGDTQGLYYYYHTMASALSAYGQDVIVDAKGIKHDWRSEYQEKMKALQRPDGSFANPGPDRWMEQVPELATTYVVLGLQNCRLK